MNDREFDEYLDINSKKYIQDKYSMSLRELTTMYQNSEINLIPIYQRLFRWTGEQASKLIESILLGIPLPPIFVSVRNGKWEVIDGVQRISSILWFYGKLSDEKHKKPLTLSNLEILKELNGKTYNQLKKEYSNSLFKFFTTNCDISNPPFLFYKTIIINLIFNIMSNSCIISLKTSKKAIN